MKKETIERLREEKLPVIRRLAAALEKYGISYSPTDDNGLENVVFEYRGRIIKIAHETFFRYSGRCVCKSTGKKGEDVFIPMSDNDFYDYVKMTILINFKIERV